jgi:hypothetical protein
MRNFQLVDEGDGNCVVHKDGLFFRVVEISSSTTTVLVLKLMLINVN